MLFLKICTTYILRPEFVHFSLQLFFAFCGHPEVSLASLATCNKTARETENIKKEICKIFEENKLNITIEANKNYRLPGHYNGLKGTFWV